MAPKRHGPDIMGDDEEDEDYGNRPSPRKKQKTSRPSKSSRPKSKKRSGGRRYGGSDIEDDDDDVDEDSDDLSEDLVSEQEEEAIEYASGRKGRVAAVKVSKYQEPDTDDDEFGGIDESEEEVKPKIKKGRLQKRQRTIAASDEDEVLQSGSDNERPTLIIKLKANPKELAPAPESRGMRSRTSSKTTAAAAEHLYSTRRSSRTAHQEHAQDQQSERGRSVSGDMPRRGTRGNKRLTTTSPVEERIPTIIPEAEEESQQHDLLKSDVVMEADAEGEPDDEPVIAEEAQHDIVPESVADEDDEDEAPKRRTRSFKAPAKTVMPPPPPLIPSRATRRTTRAGRGRDEQTSDFDPDEEAEAPEDDHMSVSEASPNKDSQADLSSQQGRRSGRLAKKRASQRTSPRDSELDAEEIAAEAADLRRGGGRSRRRRQSLDIAYDQPTLRRRAQVDYRVIRPETFNMEDDDAPAISAPGARPRKTGNAYRSLFSTAGPFGGTGGAAANLLGAPGAAGNADSDSSDDELSRAANKTVGGALGMTPTAAAAANNLFGMTTNNDSVQGGGPADVGLVKNKKALADADPLGVDPNVNFDGVGGMEGHINQLKEMVLLPLLYPELFQTLHITPPRGVLFHGPPGTGKTLLARALASSVSMQGKKVTFYMRKGADALSKWVGEAERQLRLLFEEARKTQPSIIFFDEIDGLAPVRSSKQEQIHASIVATLLALMDGMDGRGQVIVIGATNRPDSVDPALRRPGRFDREFYFPLPNEKGRRAIIDIHTKGWEPALQPAFKDQLANLTKGYGGADLRALCTEAALNAIQGTYPQIYQSDDKLVVDPKQIKVLAKDFMISVQKMIPSSERSAPSGAAPLESSVEPLLRDALTKITTLLDDVLPERKKLTALEEAEFDDRDDSGGFEREMIQQRFDSARIFRPRLLVYGLQGMGQSYIGKAILHKFERLHVQSLDVANLLSDSTRSQEAAVVQLFNEARRHKPSVIYIPNVDIWYTTVSDSVIRLLKGLLRSLPPNEPVLLLGIMELDPSAEDSQPDRNLVRDLFGYSKESHVRLERPSERQRHAYFDSICQWIAMSPADFPDPENRKKRILPQLEKAPIPVHQEKVMSKQELKAQQKGDRHTLNLLKIQLNAIMEQLKRTYRGFFKPPIPEDSYSYLFDENDPGYLSTDLAQEQLQEHLRPYERRKDDKGIDGILQTETGKFYYNLELNTIEQRLVNGYYKRPKDFGADIKRLHKDAVTHGDPTRISKAHNMRINVETDIVMLEKTVPQLVAECERVYQRDMARQQKEAEEYARQQPPRDQEVPRIVPNVPGGRGVEVPGSVSLQKSSGKDSVIESGTKSNLSNGYSADHDQGHSVSDPPDEDIDMSGTDPYHMDISETQNGTTHTQPLTQFAQYGTQTQTQSQTHTQRSFITPMPPGTTLADFHNSASTTTSGKKSSSNDKSQSTSNGVGASRSHHPDLSMINSITQPLTNDSHLPDTQDMAFGSSPEFGSQPIIGHSVISNTTADPSHLPNRQTTSMPPPAAPCRTSISAILNHPNSPPPVPRPTLIPIDLHYLSQLHDSLAQHTSGFSVEQLEQTNAALVDAVWKTRGQWNRMLAVKEVEVAFNRVVGVIEEMQRVARSTQEENEMEEGSGMYGRR